MAPSVGVGVGVTSLPILHPAPQSDQGNDDMSTVVVTLSTADIEASLVTPQVIVTGVPGSVLVPITLLFDHVNPGLAHPVLSQTAMCHLRWANMNFEPLITTYVDLTSNLNMITNGIVDSGTSAEMLSEAVGQDLVLTSENFSVDGVIAHTLTTAGSGYGYNEAVTGSGGAGTGFTATATVSGWFPITGGNANNHNFNIAGDHTAVFTNGETFTVTDTSNGNDGTYTVDSSSFGGGVTSITTVEAIPSGNPIGTSGYIGLDSDPHEILNLAVTSTGTGYAVSDVITVDGDNAGTGGTITVSTVGSAFGEVKLVLVYQAVPFP